MKWFEFSIHTINEAVEPIGNILHEAGASGIVIEDSAELEKKRDSVYGEIYDLNQADYPTEGVIVKAYLSNNDKIDDLTDRIKIKINNLVNFGINLGKNKVTVTEVNDEDWANAWKKYYHPVKVSDKITIVPTWEQYERDEDEIIIELDPGMAFGTGTHPTTKMCLQALEKVVSKHNTVIDVGTGSGVLSIAAAKLGAKQIKAFDLDDVAVSAATQNVMLNNVDEVVTVAENNLLKGVKEQADIVVANILAHIIIKLIPDAAQVVKKDGYFISSGIIKEKSQDIQKVLEENSFQIIDEYNDGDWVAIIAQKV